MDKFRLAGKTFILAYDEVKNCELSEIEEHLLQKFPPQCRCDEWLLVGAGERVFCYIRLGTSSKRFDTKNPRFFDLRLKGFIISGVYDTAESGFTSFCNVVHDIQWQEQFVYCGSEVLFNRLRLVLSMFKTNRKAAKDVSSQGEILMVEKAESQNKPIFPHDEISNQCFCLTNDESTNYSLRSPTLSNAFSSYPPSKSNSLSSNTYRSLEEKIQKLENENAAYKEENKQLYEYTQRIKEDCQKEISDLQTKFKLDLIELQREIFTLKEQSLALFQLNLDLKKKSFSSNME